MFSYSEILKTRNDSYIDPTNKNLASKLDDDNWPPVLTCMRFNCNTCKESFSRCDVNHREQSPSSFVVYTPAAAAPSSTPTMITSKALSSSRHLEPIGAARSVRIWSDNDKAVDDCHVASSQTGQSVVVYHVRKGGWNVPIGGTLKGGG